jgi:2-methylcitrate dehydratase
MPTLLGEKLVDFALGTRFDALPDRVVIEAKRHLLDTFGCAVGALDDLAPQIARRAASTAMGTPSASLIGGGESTPDWAAFANGVHIRYLDCNDTYLSLEPAHPSDNWAAIWAAGEAAGATGKDWIAAAAVAYEIQCRLSDAASIRLRGWDHTPYGAISATLAAARLLGLDQGQALHALGIAGTTGAALRLTRAGELSMWKGCAFAFAARTALFACQLAALGLSGPAPLFEGEMGFVQQVSGPIEIPHLGGPVSSDWKLPETSIKFVPAEYHSQSAIAAALALHLEVGDPRRIRSIEIASVRTAIEIIAKDPEKWRPASRETADHSLPYCTVAALVDGQISPAQFMPDRLSDPLIRSLLARTTVVEDPTYSARYPEAVPNRVTLILDDGTTLVREVAHPPGHARKPLTDAQLADKFHGLADSVLGRGRADAVQARVASLESDPAPHDVLKLLTR